MKDTIDFDEIDKHGPQEYAGTFDLTPAELDRLEIESTGPVTITAKVEKGNLPGEYLVDASATFTDDLRCSRCLDAYPFANASSFHVRFRPRPEPSGEENEEVEITEDELDVEFYTERSIPLRDLAIEQVQLSIPMKPLCDENCLGLCAQCGANRNRESCSCDTSIRDERWGALHEFREQLAKKNSQ